LGRKEEWGFALIELDQKCHVSLQLPSFLLMRAAEPFKLQELNAERMSACQ
jgi:hypothetical protein